MPNTLLTTDLIADKALDILTQKLVFVPSINRDYDERFAKTGAKIGDTLRVRVPQHGTVRKGRIMQPDPLVDVTTPVAIANQEGVDLEYSSAELALDIDEFAARYLDQRMADLAVSIEAGVLADMAQAVPSQTGNPDGALSDLYWPLLANKLLDDQLAPKDRTMLLNTSGNVQIVKALSGLFNSQPDIAKQYRSGYMGKAVGFDWASSTVMPVHANGAFGGTPLVNGASNAGDTLVTDGWTASSGILKKGDLFTIAGVNAVHAQTKADLGYLRQFVVTADVTAAASGTTNVPIYPPIYASGPQQNVSATPADNAALSIIGTKADSYGINLAYAKDFATFVTADLPLPPKKDSSRRVYEGISLRIINDFDTRNDQFLTRVDVLYGSAVLRPEYAVRVANDPANLTPPA